MAELPNQKFYGFSGGFSKWGGAPTVLARPRDFPMYWTIKIKTALNDSILIDQPNVCSHYISGE